MDSMEYGFADLIEIETTQRLLESFFNVKGVPAAIIDLEGVVLATSPWQRLCSDFHRKNESTQRRCIESDTIVANELLNGKSFSLYRCRNGLTDAASPIKIEGKHLANAFIGQFFIEKPDLAFFRRQAKEHGFDESAYLKALSEIPIIPEKTLLAMLSFLTSFSEMIASLGLRQLRQYKAEKELRESREDLNRAQAVANTGSWRLHISDNSLHWSEETYRIFGIPKGTPLTYEGFLSIVHPDDRELVDRSWQSALRGEPYDVEHRVVVNENVKWVRELAQLDLDKEGIPSGGFGTVQDITERKRATEALRRSEEQFRLLFETMMKGVLIQDTDGKIISVNPAGERILGKNWSELVGQCHPSMSGQHEVLREDGTPWPLSEHPSVMAFETGTESKGTVMGVYNPVTRGYRWINVDCVPLFGEGESRPYQVYTTFDDITDQRAAEQALRDSEERFRALFDSMSEGVALHELVYDESGRAVDYRILSTNPAYEEHTLLKSGDVRGRLASQVYVAGEPPFLQRFSDVAEFGRKDSFETSFSPLDRYFFVSATSPKKGQFLTVFEDITERKQMEEELRKSHEELDLRVKERTAELQQAGSRLKSLAVELLNAGENERKVIAQEIHDGLSSQLAAIKYYLEAKLCTEQDPAGSTEDIKRTCTLLQNSIDETRRIMANLRPSMLDDLGILPTITWFCRGFQEMNPAISPVCTFEISEEDIPDNLKTVIFRVLQEAFANISKYSRADRVLVSLKRTGTKIIFDISDNGQGYSKEKVLSGKRPQGHGFGLRGMRERVELSGGKCVIKSSPGKGVSIRAEWSLKPLKGREEDRRNVEETSFSTQGK